MTMNLIEGGFPVERRPAETIPPPATDGTTAPSTDGTATLSSSTDETRAPTPATGGAPTPIATAGEARPTRSWVPIRSLGPRHRERIVAHLVALDERSRYLRFGHQASDAQIARYVDTEQPFDCAGSFKSEGLGIALFEAIDTSDPTALVGLPLIATARLLRLAGFALP